MTGMMKNFGQGIGYAVISVKSGTVWEGFNRRVAVPGVHFTRVPVLTSEAVSIILLPWVVGAFLKAAWAWVGSAQQPYYLRKIVKKKGLPLLNGIGERCGDAPRVL